LGESVAEGLLDQRAQFSLNLLLATFNLLPLPPLDDSAAPALVMHEGSARKLQSFAM
jgi:Zn-dependent protease